MAIEYKATDIPGKILYDKEFNVKIRSITPLEQKYILSLSQKEQRTNKEYIEFLSKLIVTDNPEVTVNDLYWYDVQYLLYKIRYLTYIKFPIKLGFTCECGEKITHELDMGTIQAEEPENIQTTIILDNFGEVPIRSKIMKDDITIENFAKKLHLDIEKDIQIRLLLLDLCLISGEKSLAELYALAENGDITANDIVNIEEWFMNNIWGVNEQVTIKCPKCEKEASKGYVLSIEDFFSVV